MKQAGFGRRKRVGGVSVSDSEGDFDRLRIDKGRATGQRDAADSRCGGGEGAQGAGKVLHVVSRCHVAGVAGLQLVVQALHQFILGSGGDYLHASLQTTRILSCTLKEARRPRCPGPTGRSWAEAGSARTVGTGQSCGNLLGILAGTGAESLGSGPRRRRRVVGLRLNTEAGCLRGCRTCCCLSAA